MVGAGFGGLGMGVALRRAGIDQFAIFDHASDIGGVWRDNTYPGCHCDVPAHLYSLSAKPYRDTRIRYPSQPQVLAYLRSIVAKHGLGRHLRLGTAITQATYLDDQARWELTTGDGEHVLAEVVVFAVGQLHRPHLPEIPGRETFTGPAFHTARWDHEVDLRNRDVAVIGTGASAAQILPHLTQLARHVRVFQRTPHWVLPKPATGFGPSPDDAAAARRAPLLPPQPRRGCRRRTGADHAPRLVGPARRMGRPPIPATPGRRPGAARQAHPALSPRRQTHHCRQPLLPGADQRQRRTDHRTDHRHRPRRHPGR